MDVIIQWIANVLHSLGVFGALISMALDGSSVPFPGIVVILTYGYLLDPDWMELIGMAGALSAVYTSASYIPYGIGYKLEEKIPRRYRRKLIRGKRVFRRYGLATVALTRPIGLGNYISYVAGICKVSAWKYGILTFMGIYSWSLAILWLGRLFKGSAEAVSEFFVSHQGYIYAGIAIVLAGYFGGIVFRKRKIRSIDSSKS